LQDRIALFMFKRIILTCLLMLSFCHSYMKGQCPPPLHPDYEPLMAFYNNIGYWDVFIWCGRDEWEAGFQGTNCNPCDWYGVECDISGRVVLLDLEGCIYNTSLPPEIGDLDSLQYLKLSHLISEIPPEIGQLTNLTYLVLRHGALEGNIPSELGNLSKLIPLNLRWNNLSGSLPIELSNLVNTTSIQLSHNNLVGCFDTSLLDLCGSMNLDNNPYLLWEGDMDSICYYGTLSDQIGAPCNDNNDTNGTDDIINADCSCGDVLNGCTDPDACNYEPNALYDNGSCLPVPTCNNDICLGDVTIYIPGLDPCECMVSEAQVLGCMDNASCNFNPLANCDDGSCISGPIPNSDICLGDITSIDPMDTCTVIIEVVQILGCTDSAADNYNLNANCDDGSCVISSHGIELQNSIPEFSIYQNQIIAKAQNIEFVELSKISGQIAGRWRSTRNSFFTQDISNLESGTYIIRVYYNSGKSYTGKFTKI